MEQFFISLGTYALIDLISLAILVAFKDKFIRAARYGFELLNIRPVVNNYNTYRTHEESFASTEDEDEESDEDFFDEIDEEEEEEEEKSDEELLESMGGENINYGWKVDEEDKNDKQ